jgi:hypothetical protein
VTRRDPHRQGTSRKVAAVSGKADGQDEPAIIDRTREAMPAPVVKASNPAAPGHRRDSSLLTFLR